MDADRFDDVLRALVSRASRRGILRALSSALLATLPSALTRPEVAAKKWRKRKKRKKKRRAVVSPPPPVCTGKPDDSSCDGTGKCLAGVCNQPPTCRTFLMNCSGPNTGTCCSDNCGPATAPFCFAGGAGKHCLASNDCFSESCIGHRCQRGGTGSRCLSGADCLSNSCDMMTGRCQ